MIVNLHDIIGKRNSCNDFSLPFIINNDDDNTNTNTNINIMTTKLESKTKTKSKSTTMAANLQASAVKTTRATLASKFV